MALGFARRVAQLLSPSWLWLSHGRHPLGMITLAIATNRGGGWIMFFFKKVSYIYIHTYIYMRPHSSIFIHHVSFPCLCRFSPQLRRPNLVGMQEFCLQTIHLKKKKTMQYCIATYYIAISCSPKETQCSHIIYIHIPFRKISSNLTWQ